MPMQDDLGVCVHHQEMFDKVSAIHDAVCGYPMAIPPVKGMSAKTDILWNKYQESRAERSFIWQHIAGHILTALLSGGGVLLLMFVKGILK